MRAIMISIKPKYVSMILNKTKTIEIRKRFPSDYQGWVYIYCTKGKQKLLYSKTLDYYALEVKHDDMQNALSSYEVNGKVVARFWCDKVEKINNRYCRGMLIDSCLTNNELNDYLGNYQGYAIHITKLEIFDKPKEISEFSYNKKYKNCSECPYQNDIGYTHCNTCIELVSLKRPPQSFMYIEV